MDKFHDHVTKFYRIYRIRIREEIANSLIFIYKMKKQEYVSLADFTSKFLIYIDTTSAVYINEQITSRSLGANLALFINPQ